MYLGYPRSSFATQDYKASEGVVVTPRSGGRQRRSARTRYGPPILSFLRMKIRGLVV